MTTLKSMPNTDPDNQVLPVAVGVIWSPNYQEVFIAKRENGVPQGGLWEFPGGKVEVGETYEQALIRELREELNITVTRFEFWQTLNHVYPDMSVSITFFHVYAFNGAIRTTNAQPWCWVKLSDLVLYDFPEINKPIIEQLAQRLVSTIGIRPRLCIKGHL